MKTASRAPSLAAVLGAIAALFISFGHLGPSGAAALTSAATALGTLAVIGAGAKAGKPVSLQAVTGAVTVLFSDLALFGIRMSADERGALVSATGALLSLALHLVHVTVTAGPAPAPLPAVPHRPSAPGVTGPGEGL
jgi:hypothetical protein